MEQRAQGTLQIWAEPFVPLRVPKLFNLRTDPFERADVTSNTYYDWFLDNDYIALAATAIVDPVPGDVQGVPAAPGGARASRSTRWSRSSRRRSRPDTEHGRAARLLERRGRRRPPCSTSSSACPRRESRRRSGSPSSTTTARSGARSRCRSRPTSSSAGSTRWPRPTPRSARSSRGRRRYDRDYAWLGQVMVEHYEGDDTNVRTLLGGVIAAHAGISVDDFEAAGGCVPAHGAASDARPRLPRVRLRTDGRAARATWTRTGSRTTSPRAAAATSCGRSARRCTASRATG